MTPDRRTLLAVLLADVFVLAGALFILRDRYLLAKNRLPDIVTASPEAGRLAPAPAADLPSPAPDMPPVQKDAAQKPKNVRNILFSYRNSKPARVEIIGSFNSWTPQPMTKGKNHTWSLMVPLEPGDYTYNYLVDGKVIRDPNNRRTAPEGRSLLSVKPPES